MLKNLFNEKKAAQAAAYFLFRAGGPLSVLKLMKLLYFAERRSFEKFGEPMIGDRLVSMPHGPVLSCTHNHMNGELPSTEGGWEFWIAGRAEHDLALRDPGALRSPEEDLLELSDADLDVLGEIWGRGPCPAFATRTSIGRFSPRAKGVSWNRCPGQAGRGLASPLTKGPNFQ